MGPTRDPVQEALIHRCVVMRAKDFTNLLTRLEIELPKDTPDRSISQLVDDIVGIEDMLHHRKASRSGLGKWLHWDSFSSSVKEWKQKLNELEGLLERWGFNY